MLFSTFFSSMKALCDLALMKPLVLAGIAGEGLNLKWEFKLFGFVSLVVVLVVFVIFLRRNKRFQNDLTNSSKSDFSVNTSRLLLFFGTLIISIASLAYALINEDFDIKLYASLTISALVLTTFILTFLSELIRRNISKVLIVVYSMVVLNFIFLVYYSSLDPFFIFAQVIALSLGTVIFSKTKHFIIFGSIATLTSLVVTLNVEQPQFNSLFYLLVIVSILFVSIISIYIRLSLVDKLIFSDSVIRDASSLVMAFDKKGNVIYVNNTFTKVLGYGEEEVLGEGWWKVRKVISNDNNPYYKIQKGEIETTATVLLETKYKTQRWIQWNNTKLDNGVFVGIGTDITERREYEQRFRELVESAKDIIYTTDSKGFMTYANDMAAQFTEYSKEELIGKNYIDLIDEEYKKSVGSFYKKQLLNKISESYHEFPFRTRSGKTLWVGQSVLFKYESQTGELLSTQVICRDVNDRVLAEQKLKQHNRDLNVINRVKEIILTSDNLADTYEKILLYMGLNSDKTSYYSINIFSKTKDTINIYSLNVSEKKVIKSTHPITPDLIDLVANSQKHNLSFGSDTSEAELYHELHQPTDIYNSAVIMPIKVAHKTYGFIGVYSTDMETYGASHDILVGDICDSLANFFVQYEQRQIIEETSRRMEDYSKQLEILNEAKARLIKYPDLNELYEGIIELLYEKIENVYRVSILIHDLERKMGTLIFKDSDNPKVGRKTIPAMQIPAVANHLQGRIYEVSDYETYEHPLEEDRFWSNKGVRSVVSFPITIDGKLFASINLLSKIPNNFTDQQKALVYEINDSAVTVIEQMLYREIISEKNKDIADNINYAKRIQNALMPTEEVLNSILPNSFLIFSQRDSLGGDFYWFEKRDDNIFVAVGDCTGHGVSGSLLTILASDYMKQAVEEKKLTDPALILEHLNSSFVATLNKYRKDEDEILDGLDISIGVLNIKNHLFMFSAAMHTMYLIRDQHEGHGGELIEIKGNRKPIGGSDVIDSVQVNFTTNLVQLYKNDVIYLTTDGYTDQFHHTTEKRYGRARLQQLLLQINDKDIKEQKQIVLQEHEKWKGGSRQTDDICFIAFKI